MISDIVVVMFFLICFGYVSIFILKIERKEEKTCHFCKLLEIENTALEERIAMFEKAAGLAPTNEQVADYRKWATTGEK